MDHCCVVEDNRKMETPRGHRRSTGEHSCKRSAVKSQRSCSEYKRSDNTLVSLTQQFMHLLMNSPGWRIDFNQAAEVLGVGFNAKRRLYDVTGVLLGASLIWRPSKNTIAWTGGEALDDCTKTAEEIAALIEDEKRIDQDIEYMKQLHNKMSTFDEAYVTKEDVAPLFKDQTVMFIKAPASTELLVPTESDTYMFSLKSPSEPIDVFLFSDTEEDNEAVSADIPDDESVKGGKIHKEPTNRRRALKEVGNIRNYGSSFSDTASVLLRGLDPGPFKECELTSWKTKKHPINFIPLEPGNKQNETPIPSYRAESASFRALVPHKRRKF